MTSDDETFPLEPSLEFAFQDENALLGQRQPLSELATPDAILGLGSYSATMALAAMGGKDRLEEMPWVPLALAAKVAFDAATAAKLSVDQWTKHRAFCFWCLLAAAATFAMVPLVIPETIAAARAINRA